MNPHAWINFPDSDLLWLGAGAAALLAVAFILKHRPHRSNDPLCPSCRTDHPAHARFCPQCGRQLQ